MYICQNCKKRPATKNFIESLNGETVELHLCDACYQYKYGEFEQSALNAMFNGLFGYDRPVEQKICKACGMSLAEYERTGLLGCPSCYDVFKEELMPVIDRIHGNTRHVGKEGGDYTSEHELRLRLKELQTRLETALQRGDFAEAGKLNRQMTFIKKKIAGGGGNG